MALDWDNFVRQVMDRVDLSEFLAQYTTLKRSGSRYMGCCPLHAEKKPSFSVSPDVGLWHCFGCGKGGNIFTFLIEKESMTFFEAAELLSERYNIPLPKSDRREAASPNKVIFEIHRIAEDFFASFIRSSKGEPFKEYLRERKITKDIVEKFNIGASPDEWDNLLNHLRKKGFKDQIILSSGLALKSEHGNIYDRFRNRLMIPIRDHINRTVGFGGRVIGEGEPKYLNSPESPIFKKSEILFAFPLAKDSIRKSDTVIVMEGYTDVMRAHQKGLTNSVASMGTALTSRHIERIGKLAKSIIIAFDGDDAGISAAIRSSEELIKTDLVAKVIIFDYGLDPEEFLRLKGKSEFIKILRNAKECVRFLIDCLIPKDTPREYKEREIVLKKTMKYLTHVLDSSERNKILTETASRLELSVDLARSLHKDFDSGLNKLTEKIVKPKSSLEKPSEIETHIMRYLVNFPQLRTGAMKHLDPSEFEYDIYKKFLAMLFDPDFPIKHEKIQQLPQVYNNNEFSTLVSYLENSMDESHDYLCKDFCFWIAKLKERSFKVLRQHNKHLIYEASQLGDMETVEKLQKQNADLACLKEWYMNEFQIDID